MQPDKRDYIGIDRNCNTNRNIDNKTDADCCNVPSVSDYASN
jgi:hypothetical protein